MIHMVKKSMTEYGKELSDEEKSRSRPRSKGCRRRHPRQRHRRHQARRAGARHGAQSSARRCTPSSRRSGAARAADGRRQVAPAPRMTATSSMPSITEVKDKKGHRRSPGRGRIIAPSTICITSPEFQLMAKRDFTTFSASIATLRGRNQEGLPQAGHEAPSGPQSGQSQGGRDTSKEAKEAYEILRRAETRPTTSTATPASIRRPAWAAAVLAAQAVSPTPSAASSTRFSAAAWRRRTFQRLSRRRPALQPRNHARTAAFGTETKIRIPTMEACEPARARAPRPAHSRRPARPARAAARFALQQGFFSIQQTCPKCHGTGKFIADPAVVATAPDASSSTRRWRSRSRPGSTRAIASSLRRRRTWHQWRPIRRPVRADHLKGARRLPARAERPALRDADQFHDRGARRRNRNPDARRRSKSEDPGGNQSGKIFRLRGKGIKGVRSHATATCCATSSSKPGQSDRSPKTAPRTGEIEQGRRRTAQPAPNRGWIASATSLPG